MLPIKGCHTNHFVGHGGVRLHVAGISAPTGLFVPSLVIGASYGQLVAYFVANHAIVNTLFSGMAHVM